MAVEEFCAACGHSQKWHNDGLRKCNHMESLRPYVRCDCESFVSPEPSRRAAVDVDAVLNLVREYAIACKAIADGSDYAVGEARNYLAAIRALLEPHDAARLRETIARTMWDAYWSSSPHTAGFQWEQSEEQNVWLGMADAVIRAIGVER